MMTMMKEAVLFSAHHQMARTKVTQRAISKMIRWIPKDHQSLIRQVREARRTKALNRYP